MIKAAGVTEVTDGDFEAEVIGAELPVLVEFTADWCPPCRQMGPVLLERCDRLDHERVALGEAAQLVGLEVGPKDLGHDGSFLRGRCHLMHDREPAAKGPPARLGRAGVALGERLLGGRRRRLAEEVKTRGVTRTERT